jgi:uncharacterized protein YggU (UPF0235/DUF167 family)
MALLAEAIGVARGSVTIERGLTARTKRVRIDGADPATVIATWPGILVEPG